MYVFIDEKVVVTKYININNSTKTKKKRIRRRRKKTKKNKRDLLQISQVMGQFAIICNILKFYASVRKRIILKDLRFTLKWSKMKFPIFLNAFKDQFAKPQNLEIIFENRI